MPEFSRSKLVRYAIFSYSTEHLAKKDKVRFFYSLKGRGKKTGIIKNSNTEQLGRTVLLTQITNANKIQDFLNSWHCKFQKREVLIQHG